MDDLTKKSITDILLKTGGKTSSISFLTRLYDITKNPAWLDAAGKLADTLLSDAGKQMDLPLFCALLKFYLQKQDKGLIHKLRAKIEITPEYALLPTLHMYNVNNDADILTTLNYAGQKFISNIQINSDGLYCRHSMDMEWIFLELGSYFDNTAFLLASKNISIKAEIAAGGTTLTEMLVQDLLSLRKAFLSGEVNVDRKIDDILKKRKKALKKRRTSSQRYFIYSLIKGTIFQAAFEYYKQDRYLETSRQIAGELAQNSLLHDEIAKNPAISDLFFNALDPKQIDFSLLPILRRSHRNKSIHDDYPVLNISYGDFRRKILSGSFYKTIIILMAVLPERLYAYFSGPAYSTWRLEQKAFIKFVRTVIKVSGENGIYIASALELEIVKLKLRNKMASPRYKPSPEGHNTEPIQKLIRKELKVIQLNWHPIIKIWSCTFDNLFLRPNRTSIALHYDPVTDRIKETILDPMNALILQIFRRKHSMEEAIEKTIRQVGDDGEKTHQSIERHIRALLRAGLLKEQ